MTSLLNYFIFSIVAKIKRFYFICSRKYILGFIDKPQKILGWGRTRSGLKAAFLAEKTNGKYFLLEDGFIRSVKRYDPPVSIVVDNNGIYYDSNVASRIESCILRTLTFSEEIRAKKIIEKWREYAISKYNSNHEYSGHLPKNYVLVIDQIANDRSISYGQADKNSFDKMLQSAFIDYPDCTVVLKMHPDIYTKNNKSSNLDISKLQSTANLLIIAQSCHPVRLIKEAKAVYAVTSQVGFEALIWGKTVHCFGMPFYAGYGLTIDKLAPPERRSKVTLEQMVHGALIEYPLYFNPKSQRKCEIEEAMDYIKSESSFVRQT